MLSSGQEGKVVCLVQEGKVVCLVQDRRARWCA